MFQCQKISWNFTLLLTCQNFRKKEFHVCVNQLKCTLVKKTWPLNFKSVMPKNTHFTYLLTYQYRYPDIFKISYRYRIEFEKNDIEAALDFCGDKFHFLFFATQKFIFREQILKISRFSAIANLSALWVFVTILKKIHVGLFHCKVGLVLFLLLKSRIKCLINTVRVTA